MGGVDKGSLRRRGWRRGGEGAAPRCQGDKTRPHPEASSRVGLGIATRGCQLGGTLGLGEVKGTRSKKGTGQGVLFLLQGVGEAGLVSAGPPCSVP